MLKPRSEPEDTKSGFDAEDDFAPMDSESWLSAPEEPDGKDALEAGADAAMDDDADAEALEAELRSAHALQALAHDHEAEHDPEAEQDPFEEKDALEPIPTIINPYRTLAEKRESDDPWLAEPLVDPMDAPEPVAVHDQPRLALEETDPAPFTAPPPAAAQPAPSVVDLLGVAESPLGDVAAPRISIHIFCEQEDTAGAANDAAQDRRMSRASTAVIMGGLPVAVQQYQNQPTPALVIVESRDHGPVLIQLLDRLAEVCDPGTKVVVIGGHNDIALYRELMRRGVSEYLVPPIRTLQLIRAITSLYADPSAPFVGRQIAFCGARGGVGSSTIAHNLAYTLSERMMTNTVIVDFDLPFGTAGLDFNQDPLQGVADALGQPDRLDPVLLDRMMARCTERLSLFAAPATLDDDYEISAEAFEEVTGKIRTTAPYIVLDLPHLWSNWMRKVLLTADDVVITASPDLASLRNAKNIVDLMRQTRANDAPPWLVLNQVGVPGRPEIPIKDFSAALGLEPALVMPFDPKLFGQAANNGQMIEELGDKSKAAVGLQQLAQILARREPPPQPKKSMLASLFQRK